LCREFATDYLAVYQPSLVICSGDLTDGKTKNQAGGQNILVWNNRTRITTYFFLYRAVLQMEPSFSLFVDGDARGKIVADPGGRCDLFWYDLSY
jgi:hypothetical protein